jgi:TPR repeat protein
MQQRYAVVVLALVAFFSNIFFISPAGACPSPTAGKAQPEFVRSTPQAELLRRSETGDADAQYWLARWYLEDQRSEINYAEAARWHRRSAEQGCAAAQYALGALYAKGLGVAEDATQVAVWYRAAAEQGWPAAENGLGYL